jgi:clan AA aspartic protease
MRGHVSSRREAVIELLVKGPRRRAQRLRAIVDTGFTECLALPHDRIASLGLPLRGAQRIILADGSDTELNVYTAVVRWHGIEISVPALEVRGSPIIGMALLDGSRLTLDAIPNGPVCIEPLG